MTSFFKLILTTIAGITVGLNWSNPVQATPIEEEIKATGILNVGVRTDSPLFGYGTDQKGYCTDFANSLARVLSDKLSTPVEVNLVPSTTQNRWELVREGTVHLECGPNTIVTERETEHEIKFSQSFFVTATQIFTTNDITEEALKDGTIGTIDGTTNAEEMRAVYPEGQVNDSFTNREEGIQAVRSQELTGFASDGILLIGTAISLELQPDDYKLVTPVVDDLQFCAAYGMILPAGDEQDGWRTTVNDLIGNSEEGAKVWDWWFQELLPYVGQVIQDCQ